MQQTPSQKKSNPFLPKIIDQNKNIATIKNIVSTPQSKKDANSIVNTPTSNFKIVIKKVHDTPQIGGKTIKRNSLDDNFSSKTQKRNSSVLAQSTMKPSLSQNTLKSNNGNNVATLLQQKQRQVQSNQYNIRPFTSKTATNFFKRGSPSPSNLQVPSNNKIEEKQKKPELSLEVFHRKSIVYDESPAKMQQIRQVQKYTNNNNNNNNYHLEVMNKSSDFQYPQLSQRSRDCILDSIMEIQQENLNSSEKSPNLQQLMSPLTPTPKILQQFYDPRKTSQGAFNFNDAKLYGEEALQDNPLLKFNKNYKQLEKIVQVNSHFNNEGSIDIAMLQETMGNNILPRKLGIVKDVRHQFVFPKLNAKHKLDVSNQNIAQRYHEMFSSAMKHEEMNQLYSINLAMNNLTGQSLKTIANNLPTKLQKINLESNNLGTNCAIGILPLLNTNSFISLRILNLENNNISDLGFSQLLEGLLNNRSVYSINLSHNKLTDGSGGTIRQYLKQSSYLQELYLHWNKISSQGGLAIAEGLEHNTVLAVLDLSHNGLGALQKLRCGLAIIQSSSIPSTSMRHLDLSFNMFQKEEASDISKYLEENNRTLYGLHFEGNHGQGIVDPRGFLKFNQNQLTDDSSHIGMLEKRRIKGGKSLGQNKLQNYNCNSVDNCWICDGWQEVKFEIKVGCSDSFLGNPVFLHLDFENYRPHYMEVDQHDAETFTLTRMCPPNRKINFFFSDPTQPIIYYSKHYPYTKFKYNEDLDIKFYCDLEKDKAEEEKERKRERKQHCANHFQFLTKQTSIRNVAKKYFKLQYLDTTVIEYLQPTFVNCIETSNNKPIFTKHDYDPQIHSRPREPETYFMITKTNKWCFEISLFRTYIRDSLELFDKCFETDWNESRLEKITTQYGDAVQSKAILKKNYQVIKNLYRYYSSLCLILDIPSITQNQYSNLLLKSKITDGKLLKISDVDINFITTNSDLKKEKTHRNPDKALVRHEFLESLGRLAIDKYVRNNVVQTSQDALNLIFNDEEILQKFIEVGDPQVWRDKRYWNEECDMVLKKYLGFIKILWESVADSKKTEKRFFLNYKTLNIFEFQEMVKYYDLLDDNLTERDILLSFNLAMMTQVDELNSDRFIQMNFVEFLESLARLAEKKQMVPIGESAENYTAEERKELALHYKLESMLDQMQEKYENIQIQKRGALEKQKQQNFVIKKAVKMTPLVPDAKDFTKNTFSSNKISGDADSKTDTKIPSQEYLSKPNIQTKIIPSPRNSRIVPLKNNSNIKLQKQRSRTIPRNDLQIKEFLISSLDRIDED